jgi:hypothetical protein
MLPADASSQRWQARIAPSIEPPSRSATVRSLCRSCLGCATSCGRLWLGPITRESLLAHYSTREEALKRRNCRHDRPNRRLDFEQSPFRLRLQRLCAGNPASIHKSFFCRTGPTLSTAVEVQFVGVLQSNSRREFRTETGKSSSESEDGHALRFARGSSER